MRQTWTHAAAPAGVKPYVPHSVISMVLRQSLLKKMIDMEEKTI